MKKNEIFEECVKNVDPQVKAEVDRNVDKRAIRIGDEVEWVGANGVVHATIVEFHGELVAQLPNECKFRLSDVQSSKTFRTIWK